MTIPEQYLPVMPYLVLKGAGEFAAFAITVLGATEQLAVPGEDGKIMHGELRINKAVIMYGEASEQWKEKTAALFIYVEPVDGIHAAALANGAKELEPPQQKEYGYSSGFEDPFGNYWFITDGETH